MNAAPVQGIWYKWPCCDPTCPGHLESLGSLSVGISQLAHSPPLSPHRQHRASRAVLGGAGEDGGFPSDPFLSFLTNCSKFWGLAECQLHLPLFNHCIDSSVKSGVIRAKIYHPEADVNYLK
jgi:hypothetical protein